jgi:UDP:flavonoid glycosyltransferase YjiC (YdhE family)
MTAAQKVAAPVLIVWEHGSNFGHLGRLLPIAVALQARGVRAVFAVARPAEFAPYVRTLGVAVVQAPLAAPPPPADDVPLCPAEVWLRCGFANPSDAQACVRQWLAIFDSLKPTAVLVDASPMALYAAQVAGISPVAIGHGFELPPADAGVCFAPWQVSLEGRVPASEQALALVLTNLAHAVKPSGGRALGSTVGEVLKMCSQALCVWPELDHFDRPASSTPYLGPIWHALPGAQAVHWPDKPGAKVLCYLTLANKRYDLLWQALQMHGANVVVVSPGAADWLCEQVRGWGVHVCAEPIELVAALQECNAVIGHGGLGLTSMALQAGKPLMLLPSQLEQGLLAYQLVRRGLAITTMSFLNKQQMHSRVAQLLQDAALQTRVVEFGQRYAAFDPAQSVQKVVAMLLGDKTPVIKITQPTPC